MDAVRALTHVLTIDERVGRLEKSARRWRLLCFAMMVLAVGMGAKAVVSDAEFKNVTVNRLDVVGPGGELLGQFGGQRGEDGKYYGVMAVIGDNKNKVTSFGAGQAEPFVVNKTGK